MTKCPNCGNYMTYSMFYNAGYPCVMYECACGNVIRINQTYSADNKTYIDKDLFGMVSNRTETQEL